MRVSPPTVTQRPETDALRSRSGDGPARRARSPRLLRPWPWAGGPRVARPRRGLAAVAVLAAAAGSASASARPLPRAATPAVADLARSAPFADAVRAPAATLPDGAFGGPYTAATGEAVNVFTSRRYAQDATVNQRWADFLAGLAHGSELSSVTLYLAPAPEIGRLCGGDAIACYQPRSALVVAPADDPSFELSAEAVVTHEYGHHVAANRVNPPWRALDWGTKRWASYQEVCVGARTGALYPGAEDAVQYSRNPGEGFAESYRVLNERRAGLAEPPWDIVDEVLRPDDTALARLERDVVDPWTQVTAAHYAGTFTAKGVARRTYGASTALDGSLRVTLRTAGARVRLDILATGGKRLGTAVTSAATPERTVSKTICGQRSLTVRLTRLAGAGAYSLDVSKP